MAVDRIHHVASPLGGITLASDGEALTGLWFDGQLHFGAGLDTSSAGGNGPVFYDAVFEDTENWLRLYFSGKDPGFMPRLRLRGSPFRVSVWRVLMTVPFGHTVSYGWIAARLSSVGGAGKMSARAVGGAVSRNPVSLIVPCHRVIGADGRLTGYAAGMFRKERLLRMEAGAYAASSFT